MAWNQIYVLKTSRTPAVVLMIRSLQYSIDPVSERSLLRDQEEMRHTGFDHETLHCAEKPDPAAAPEYSGPEELCAAVVSKLSNSGHLQQHESAVEGDTGYYHCTLCSYSTKAKLNLIQHVRSMKHQRSESLRKLQRLQKGLPEEEEELSTIFTIQKCPSADAGSTG
ncbi:zinc finger homeobox protein 3-like [Arapaima gigas]